MTRRAVLWARRGRLGHRGAVLLVFGVFYMLLGFGNLSATEGGSSALVAAYRWHLTPTSIGLITMAVGVLAVVSSRWPPRKEVRGYVALSALSWGYSAVYFLGWVSYGIERLWLVAGLFALLGLILHIASGWPEDEGES